MCILTFTWYLTPTGLLLHVFRFLIVACLKAQINGRKNDNVVGHYVISRQNPPLMLRLPRIAGVNFSQFTIIVCGFGWPNATMSFVTLIQQIKAPCTTGDGPVDN